MSYQELSRVIQQLKQADVLPVSVGHAKQMLTGVEMDIDLLNVMKNTNRVSTICFCLCIFFSLITIFLAILRKDYFSITLFVAWGAYVTKEARYTYSRYEDAKKSLVGAIGTKRLLLMWLQATEELQNN